MAGVVIVIRRPGGGLSVRKTRLDLPCHGFQGIRERRSISHGCPHNPARKRKGDGSSDCGSEVRIEDPFLVRVDEYEDRNLVAPCLQTANYPENPEMRGGRRYENPMPRPTPHEPIEIIKVVGDCQIGDEPAFLELEASALHVFRRDSQNKDIDQTHRRHQVHPFAFTRSTWKRVSDDMGSAWVAREGHWI